MARIAEQVIELFGRRTDTILLTTNSQHGAVQLNALPAWCYGAHASDELAVRFRELPPESPRNRSGELYELDGCFVGEVFCPALFTTASQTHRDAQASPQRAPGQRISDVVHNGRGNRTFTSDRRLPEHLPLVEQVANLEGEVDATLDVQLHTRVMKVTRRQTQTPTRIEK